MVEMFTITVFTNDNNLFLLPGFLHQLNKHWENPPMVRFVGFNPPDRMPFENYFFVSMSRKNYPASKWSNQIIQYYKSSKIEYDLIMLEDYWLNEPTKFSLLDLYDMTTYLRINPEILRIDLSGDRASHPRTIVPSYLEFPLIETTRFTPYQMSFQSGIWNIHNLLKVLKPGENPWQSEVEGTTRLKEDPRYSNLRVLGVSEKIIKYTPVYRSNKKEYQIGKLAWEDKEELWAKGYL
jgi:hypothetical protein